MFAYRGTCLNSLEAVLFFQSVDEDDDDDGTDDDYGEVR